MVAVRYVLDAAQLTRLRHAGRVLLRLNDIEARTQGMRLLALAEEIAPTPPTPVRS